jgi:hypothetical protein
MSWVPNGLHDEQVQTSHVQCSVCPVGRSDSVKMNKNISKAELRGTDVNTAVQTALKPWQPEGLQLLWYVQ